MSAWFPYGFEECRAAYQAAARLRDRFPVLKVNVAEGRVEISGILPAEEAAVVQFAAGAMIACRNGLADAA
jgi:hypothetical protein